MTDMPQELVDELSGQLKDDRKYTAHDHVLAYINIATDGATTNDLLVYLYCVMGKVTKRAYLYHILTRLRKRGHIVTSNMRNAHGDARSFITTAGIDAARPAVKVAS